jgi:ADP-ribose pyrophosphatase YjhB (NUDIX family)
METNQTKCAGGIVLNKKGLVLVVNQDRRSWSLPKGHVEKGETELKAARREIREESGVEKLKLVKKLPSYMRYRIDKTGSDDFSELKNIQMYLFTTAQMDLAPTDPVNPEARWVKKDEVVSLLTHPKDKEFFTSILPHINVD